MPMQLEVTIRTMKEIQVQTTMTKKRQTTKKLIMPTMEMKMEKEEAMLEMEM